VKYVVAVTILRRLSAAVVAGGTGYASETLLLFLKLPKEPLLLEPQWFSRFLHSVVAVLLLLLALLTSSGGDPSNRGSYFAIQANPVAQFSTSGAGTGATFTLTSNRH